MENRSSHSYVGVFNSTSGTFTSFTKIALNGGSFFSDHVVENITFANIVIISSVLSIFGIVTNITNIIVFVRVGFQETINVSLLAIAVSDVWSLTTLLWKAICYNPLVIKADLPFLSKEVEMLTAGGPHQMAMNATSWLTAFVTFERCLCIAFPMKVKAIITVNRTKIYVVIVFFLVVVCQVPIYYATRLDWKFVPERNRTLFGLVFIENRELIDKLSFYLVNFMSTITSFSVILICTAILIVKLRQSSNWRQKVMADESSVASREVRVIKMVASVATIFIVCYTPSVILAIYMAKDTEFRIVGRYQNDFLVALNFGTLFEALNASVNIFVYYHMSTKYKSVYQRMICKGESKQ